LRVSTFNKEHDDDDDDDDDDDGQHTVRLNTRTSGLIKNSSNTINSETCSSLMIIL